MSERSNLASRAAAAIVVAAIAVGLCLAARYSYLLFHSMVELVSIVVAVSIFLIAWNARRFMENDYLLLVGIGLGFVGIVNLLHTLAFKGMNVFAEHGANLPTQLWVVLRSLTAVTLLAAPIYLQRRLRLAPVAAIYAVATAGMLAAVFGGAFPICFDEQTNSLTAFKKASEYINAAVLLMALGLLLLRRRLLEKAVLGLLGGAILLSVASGVAFTLYRDPESPANLVGHLFHLGSFYLIYRALVATCLTRPYDLLFRNLKASEEALRQSEAKYRILADNNHDVAEDRTRQMHKAVEQLREEKRRDEITRSLLELFTRHTTRKEYLDAALGVVQQWSRCRCTGIRIMSSDGHIPYEAHNGFSEAFWKQENNLSLLSDQCICTRVVQGRFEEPDRPLVTPFGSFLCTDSSKFADDLTASQRPLFRATCVKYGFATISVVPIRFGNEILGAIHLADERPNTVTKETIEFLESVSPLIGEAVHRFSIEDELRTRYQALRESQDRYRMLFDSAPICIVLTTTDGKIIATNKATSDTFLLPPGEAAGMSTETFYYYPHQREQVLKEIAEKGRLRDFDLQMKRMDGHAFPALANVDKFQYGPSQVLLVTLRDMTEHRRLEAEVLAVGEQERQRIGQDLHDSLGQNLTGIAFLASVLQRKLAARSPAEAAEAAIIERHVNECVNLSRSLARGLSPIGDKPDSLFNGLREFTGAISDIFRVQCILRHGQEVLIEDPVAAMHMYRIAQEAVHNALKHGKARNIDVQLFTSGDLVSMSIEDDGVGISSASTESSGMGLRIMQYRSASIGASLDIRPRTPQGTAVTCLLRLAPKKEAGPVRQS